MNSNHPNRSRRPFAPGRNPRPAEIAQLFADLEMTHPEIARHAYASVSTVEKWLSGKRRMSALTYEYLCLLQAYSEVERARRLWLQGRPF